MSNIGAVLEEVYGVVADRKENPKEGAYTTYLFKQGVDKICKKIGEESTEVVIAAKNKEPSELIYEISDLLYHLNVLMVEQDVSWEQISQELTSRRS